MKTYIVGVLTALVLITPNVSRAAEMVTVEDLRIQLIALLTEQVKILMAELAEMKAKEARVGKVETKSPVVVPSATIDFAFEKFMCGERECGAVWNGDDNGYEYDDAGIYLNVKVTGVYDTIDMEIYSPSGKKISGWSKHKGVIDTRIGVLREQGKYTYEILAEWGKGNPSRTSGEIEI